MRQFERWHWIVAALLLAAWVASACGPAAPTPVPTAPPASPGAPGARGRCGDGICDDAEQADPSLCPQDCPPATEAQGAASPTPAPPAAPTTARPAQPPTARPTSGVSAPPNIVVILTDDLDYAGIPYMPKLQSLLTAQGTTLSNFLISMPLCCPSRATILRGQYAHNTQIQGNDLPFGGFPKFLELNEEQSTIATWLQDGGYRTMLAGKYLNAFPLQTDLMHIPPGWTEWFSPMEGEAYTQYNYALNENGVQVAYGEDPEDYGTDVYARKTLEFIERSAQAGLPFFAYVNVYAPHWPTTAAPRHEDLFVDAQAPRTPNFDEQDVSDKPAYISGLPRLSDADIARIDEEWRQRLRAMQAVDEMIESIVNTLASTGQLDNTYIFFTSDNGYHHGNHRQLLGKGAPYEEEIRVTVIVRGPGVPVGQVLDHLTSNVDLAPTWAELAGVEPPDFVDGRSLMPLLRADPPPTDQWRQSLLIEHAPWERPGQARAAQSAPTNTPPGLLEPPDPGDQATAGTPGASPTGAQVPPYRGIRTARYAYIEYPTGEKELYDLQEDPYQLQNLVPTAKPELLAELAARLQELHTCSGEGCRTVEDKRFAQ